MKRKLPKMLFLGIILFPFVVVSQVGIGTTTPNNQLDINVVGKTSDGINIENTGFNSQILTEPTGSIFALNNSNALGNYNIRFNNVTSFVFKAQTFEPAVESLTNIDANGIDIGVFDKHFRRVYTRAIHTNDNTVNGGLNISIGAGGGVNSDYVFSDFAFYPFVDQTYDLGRNGNFWNNFFFVNAFTPSDKRLKENISKNDRGLSTVMRLKTYQYNYIKDKEKKKHYGFIAQELKNIIPELINESDRDNSMLAVNYIETIPIMVKAIQEQNEIISKQSEKIKTLENEIALIKESLNK
ncbi:tail fiber domain-containing protein [Pontimicrobium sp. MEBiC06410]